MDIIGFIVGIGVVCLIAAALVNYLTRSEELQYGAPFFFRGYSRDMDCSDDTYCALYVDCAAGFTYVVNPSQVDIDCEKCANGDYQFRIPR